MTGPRRFTQWRIPAILLIIGVAGCLACSDRAQSSGSKGSDSDKTAPGPAKIRPDAPSCNDVGARIAHLASQRFADLPAPKRASADKSLEALRAEVVVNCEGQFWTAEVRTCMVEAKSRDQFAACEP